MTVPWDAVGAALIVTRVAALPVLAFADYLHRRVLRWWWQVRAGVEAAWLLRGVDLDAELIDLLVEEGFYYGAPGDDLMSLADELFGDDR